MPPMAAIRVFLTPCATTRRHFQIGCVRSLLPHAPGDPVRKETPMKHRLFVIVGAGCLMASSYQLSVAGQAPTNAANAVGQTWTPPRTPDGQPDIQGTWTNFDSTPFETPG